MEAALFEGLMAKKRRHLGEILYKAGVVEKQAVIEAIKATKTSNKRLGEILLEKGLVKEEVLTKALAKQLGLKYVRLDQIEIPDKASELVPTDLIKRYNIIPLKKDNGRLTLIVSDPLDLEMMDTVRLRVGAELECCLAPPSKITEYLEKEEVVVEEEEVEEDDLKHSIDATAAELAEFGDLQSEILKLSSAADDDDGPVVRLVNLVIDNAYYMRASDIHIEPMSDRVRVRYRVDGVCLEKDNIPKNMQAGMMTRFKIMSGMDIAEKRIPQDGRIKRNIGGTDIDFRVSALPANHGESVVLRILRPDAVNIGIGALGFAEDNNEVFNRIIKRPNGIFLVTGPTGSGKTTTLYAALQELNRPDKKIITAEDPVEYNFAGMNQCQVRSEIGLTFDIILRAMLRQAPNIVLVGEIRDGEVADIAIQAALTGHLVFSTVHTNDAAGAVTRLLDMGIENFLISSALLGVLAQRLVRVICPDCKEEATLTPTLEAEMGLLHKEKVKVYSGKGCKACSNTGFRGRCGIYELLVVDDSIRELILKKSTAQTICDQARKMGMRTLREDGWDKVVKGITTVEEILRVTLNDRN